LPYIVQEVEWKRNLNAIWKIADLVVACLVLQRRPHHKPLLPAAADRRFEDNPTIIDVEGFVEGFQAVRFGLRIDHLPKVDILHLLEFQGRRNVAFRERPGMKVATCLDLDFDREGEHLPWPYGLRGEVY